MAIARHEGSSARLTPRDLYRQYVRSSVWAGTLTMLVDSAPAGGENVWVYYGKIHTLDATSSTLSTYLEDLVATRATAYAAIEWSSFATNRINVGGEQVWRQYLTWGQDQMASFLSRLAQINGKSAVPVRCNMIGMRRSYSQCVDRFRRQQQAAVRPLS